MSKLLSLLFLFSVLITFQQVYDIALSHQTFPGLLNISSATMHLSTLGSINDSGQIGRDPIYLNEFHDYPWLQQLLQVLVIKTTYLPPGRIYSSWPLIQLAFLVISSYGLGHSLFGRDGGKWLTITALLVRHAKRLMFMPFPLYTSFSFVYLLILFLTLFSIRRNAKYLILSGVTLAEIFLTHINSFIACAALPAILLLFDAGHRRRWSGYLRQVLIIYLVLFLTSSCYWGPLFMKYRFRVRSPTQEFQFYDYYLYPWPQYSFPSQSFDMVLNRITSAVEGSETICDGNNVLIFILAMGGLILLFKKRPHHYGILLAVLTTFLFARWHHVILRPVTAMHFQFFRFSDYLEIAYSILAGYFLHRFEKKSAQDGQRWTTYVVLFTLVLYLVFTTHIVLDLNPFLKSASWNWWGIISSYPTRLIGLTNKTRYPCFGQAAHFLENADGVVWADPFYAQLLNVFNQKKYFAAPLGFSNVFVDSGTREGIARYLYYSHSTGGSIVLRQNPSVSHVVLDPFSINKWPLGIGKFSEPLFFKEFECNQDELPTPDGDFAFGPIKIYRVNRTHLNQLAQISPPFASCFYGIPHEVEFTSDFTHLHDVLSRSLLDGIIIVHGEDAAFDQILATRMSNAIADSVVMDDKVYEGNKGEKKVFFIGGPSTNDWIKQLSVQALDILYFSSQNHSCILRYGDDLIVGGYNENSTIESVDILLRAIG